MQYDISVIIEWENVLLAEQERCFRMLERLRKQVLESTRSVEILVMFNPGQVDRTIIEAAIGRYLTTPAADGRRLACRIEAGPDLHYYQLKNLGIRLAHGEVIAFLDSDVIPEAGWLPALTEPFWSNPEIQVLSGHTYLDPKDLISRAFALGWFFPLRSSEPALMVGSRHFFANNLAFRRPVLEAHPFPDMDEGMTRGACSMLKAALARDGIVIWGNSAAQTSHPAPGTQRPGPLRGAGAGPWTRLGHGSRSRGSPALAYRPAGPAQIRFQALAHVHAHIEIWPRDRFAHLADAFGGIDHGLVLS